MGKLDGKVAFITGAARGQGRSHAVHLAQEGADVIGVDLCSQIQTVPYPMSTVEDLDETARLVEKAGTRMVARQADVRDADGLSRALVEGLEEFGRLDIVLANAGIMAHGLPSTSETDSRQAFRDSIEVMLVGVWNTLQVTVPTLISQGDGGAIVITSSTAGLSALGDGSGGGDGYYAAKHGVVGLMRAYADYLGPHSVRVNTVHPTGVNTPMVVNDFFPRYMEAYPDIAARALNRLPVPLIEPADVSRAILYLVSDEGRYVTGMTFRVDAGAVRS